MAVLTFKSSEYATFPPILKDYARYVTVIKGNSEKTVCEYLLDIRTFFRFMKTKDLPEKPARSEFEKITISDVTLEKSASHETFPETAGGFAASP